MAYLKDLKIISDNIQLKNANIRFSGTTHTLINRDGKTMAKTDSRFAHDSNKPVVSYSLTNSNNSNALKKQVAFAVEDGLINSGYTTCRGILVSGKVKKSVTIENYNITSQQTFDIVIPVYQLIQGADGAIERNTSTNRVTNVNISSIMVSTGGYIEDGNDGPIYDSSGDNGTFNVIACVGNPYMTYLEYTGSGAPKLHVPVTIASGYGYTSFGATPTDIWIYVTAWLVVKK